MITHQTFPLVQEVSLPITHDFRCSFAVLSALGVCGYNSISFSYNTIDDLGATAWARYLSKSLVEIGDAGGTELLKWVRNAPALRMACIEQNHFSRGLRKEHPQILVVV